MRITALLLAILLCMSVSESNILANETIKSAVNNSLEYSHKETLFKDKDIITEKNSGDFENLASENIPIASLIGFTQSKQGDILVNKEAYKGENCLRINEDKELTLNVNNLNVNTEYTIFFAAKTNENGTLEFRLSGFKDSSKFDYDNGNYNDAVWNDKDNMYNWLENLKITNQNWKTFRYDFTTGNSQSVRARFKSVSGIAYVDTIFIVRKDDLNETTYALPDNNNISKANRILIDNGLQFQSRVTTDVWETEKGWIKSPTADEIKDLGFTAVQYNDKPNFSKKLHEQNPNLKWGTAFGPKYSKISGLVQDSSDGKTGTPTEEEWKNGFLTTENGLGYVNNLLNMCIGDEEDYSDTLIQNLKSWFELIREKYPNVIAYHNEIGNVPQENMTSISTFNENMLRKYLRTAKPDMLSYDMSYFRERRIEQTVGGTVIPFYDNLNRYRIVSSEGYDGTGNQPIPFGQYHYSWRTGPGATTALKRDDGWYEMTESQINLYSFASWAFGAKFMSNFRWLDDNPSYLFSDYRVNADGTTSKYYIYDQFKEMIRQSKNLGPHIVRIKNDDVVIVNGEHKDKNNSTIKNISPKDNKPWSKNIEANKNVFIEDIKVKNLGQQNNGLNGDVFISYFSPLKGLTQEDKKVFTSSDPRYFMILNGLTSGDGLPTEMQQGSSYETRQQITVKFKVNSGDAVLKKVSRIDGDESNQGKVITVALLPTEDNMYEMTTTIGGGYADLYYWELGEKNSNTTTVQAVEEGKEELITGQQKYINNIEKRNLGGRAIIIGNIKDTNNVAPEPRMAININTPKKDDLVDGKSIVLDTYDTPEANIGAIGTRYFNQDLWEFRINRIQKDNNVKLYFKEYDWTKEELIENIEKVKKEAKVDDMPDILVVPDNWLLESDGLIANNSVLALNEIGKDIINFDERKWNNVYTNMSTKDGNIYSASTELSLNPIGLFVNKTLLKNVDIASVKTGDSEKDGIYDLQKKDKWTFAELEQIIDSAISNNISKNNIKLFADNEYFLRQLLISSGITDPYNFDANDPEYKKVVSIYGKLKENKLLMKDTSDEYIKAFKEGKLIFLTAPYTEVAKHLSEQYWYYEDNTTRKTVDNFLGKWGAQTYTAPKDEDGLWRVTVKSRPAGDYSMPAADWNFMLFPKSTPDDQYRAILNDVSLPVILASTSNSNDTAFIWNELSQEYKGLNTTDDLFKRGGEDYPDGRFFEATSGDNSRDIDTIRKAGLRDGYGDIFKATGIWNDVIVDAIRINPNNYEAVNKSVKSYLQKK